MEFLCIAAKHVENPSLGLPNYASISAHFAKQKLVKYEDSECEEDHNASTVTEKKVHRMSMHYKQQNKRNLEELQQSEAFQAKAQKVHKSASAQNAMLLRHENQHYHSKFDGIDEEEDDEAEYVDEYESRGNHRSSMNNVLQNKSMAASGNNIATNKTSPNCLIDDANLGASNDEDAPVVFTLLGNPQYISLQEAAKRLKVKPERVKKMAKTGVWYVKFEPKIQVLQKEGEEVVDERIIQTLLDNKDTLKSRNGYRAAKKRFYTERKGK